MPTNVRESGLEDLVVRSLVTRGGYEQGLARDYDAGLALDVGRLFRFLLATQKERLATLGILGSETEKQKFLQYLNKNLLKRGVIEVLRQGLRYKSARLDFYYVRPSAGNERAAELFRANIFSVTRQVHYALANPRLAVDLVIFLNGLPILTLELKNSLTKQRTADAVEQYKRDRSPKEPLFAFRRALAHFAVDDLTVAMCTELKGPQSVFLPFNQGYHGGAGNPPNPRGLRTA